MAQRWLELHKHQITTDDVRDVLGEVDNDLWVVSACVDCVVDNTGVQRALLDLGIARSELVAERCENTVALARRHAEALISHFENTPEDAQVCFLRSVLLQRLDRLNTYVEMECVFPKNAGMDLVEATDEWEDDPWMDKNDTTLNEPNAQTCPPNPLTISEFLRNDLTWSACEIASATAIDALRILLRRHTRALWPSRFKILQFIPEFTEPSICRGVFPSLSHETNAEVVPVQENWRPTADFVELPETREAFMKFYTFPPQCNNLAKAIPYFPALEPLNPTELSMWYKNRIDLVISATGMINVALALAQHGASQSVPALDELGEDLSLLSRLVYDAPHSKEVQVDWTLTRWYSMEPMAVVNAYLEYSTGENLVRDIWRLVVPYFYAMEARAERAGRPDPWLHTRLTYEYILTTSLDNVAAIFEVSKPTLPTTQRLIKNDEDMVRLALACLYGNSSLDKWATMSGIFECLPIWEISKDDDSYVTTAEATIASLTTFITPSTDKPLISPKNLLKFFEPLPFTVLSQALDVLDVHLESGEIFSKWHVPAPLRWFLQSTSIVSEQRAWATKMARRGKRKEERLNNVEDWERLLKDMLKLTGSGDAKSRGAFCLLTNDEVMEICLGGLLSGGCKWFRLETQFFPSCSSLDFGIAKTMLYSPSGNLILSSEAIETISLACSRELYDNARSGNYKIGDMKLAYEWYELCYDASCLHSSLSKS